MSWNTNNMPDQSGRIAIVTGANIGLGFDTAQALAKHGAEVILACRNTDKGEQAKAQMLAQLPSAKLSVWPIDLSSQDSVKAFCERYKAQHPRLDLLINNAGIMMPPFALTVDGFESQIAANYLGHFTLTALLLPLLEQTQGARVVSLSSLAHKAGRIHFDDINLQANYDAAKAYNQSKLACLIFAFELQRRLSASQCQTLSVAAHPGVAMTNLDQHLGKLSAKVFQLICQPSHKGALPTLYAAVGDDIQGGDLCGPNGFFELRGDPTKLNAKAHAYDEEVAKRLWELSEALTGVSDFIPD